MATPHCKYICEGLVFHQEWIPGAPGTGSRLMHGDFDKDTKE